MFPSGTSPSRPRDRLLAPGSRRHRVVPGRLTGIDILPARVQAAAARAPVATVIQADARALPFEDRRFDVVLLFKVLSSLASGSDVQRTLLEARRVLAPGGVLLCYEPRFPNPLNPRLFGYGTTTSTRLESRRALRGG